MKTYLAHGPLTFALRAKRSDGVCKASADKAAHTHNTKRVNEHKSRSKAKNGCPFCLIPLC